MVGGVGWCGILEEVENLNVLIMFLLSPHQAPEVVVCPDKHKPSDNKEMKHLYYTPVVDAWAVGVLAYELIIGRPPFDKVRYMICTHNWENWVHPHMPPSYL